MKKIELKQESKENEINYKALYMMQFKKDQGGFL